jgi:hypothetical protein
MGRILLLFVTISLLAIGCNNETKEEAKSDTPTAPAAAPQSMLNETGTQRLVALITDYYQLKDALVASSAAKADEASNKLMTSADSMRSYLQTDSTNGAIMMRFLDSVSIGGRNIVAEKDETTEKKRIHFETVSNAMFELIRKAELKNAGVYRQYCPMAFNDKGAYWLSNETEIKNPYFGKKMLECGEVTDTLR